MKRLSVFVVLSFLSVACAGGGNNAASLPESEVAEPVATIATVAVDTAAFPVTITHDRGETTLEQPAERVVVMSEEFIELAIALDLAPVGVGPWRNEPTGETFTTLPHIEQPIPGEPVYLNGSEPSMEAILALQPDLILHHASAADAETDLYESFSQIAPTLAYFGADVDGWKSAIQGLGVATGYSTRAEEVISDYDERVAELHAEMTPVVERVPEVTLLIGNADTLGIFDERMALGGLVETLGFTLSIPDSVEMPEAGYSPISPEILSEITADTIVQMGPANNEERLGDSILSSLDIPILNTTVLQGMGFTGPFAEMIYLEGFVNAFNEEYIR
ncbi:MAG: ABC transporter substrate-binding protein [Chloroflexota bacterium]